MAWPRRPSPYSRSRATESYLVRGRVRGRVEVRVRVRLRLRLRLRLRVRRNALGRRVKGCI